MTTALALTIAKKMSKQLLKTGIVIGLSMLLMRYSKELGIIVMMLYSSYMVVQSSKKEMPLSKFTSIIPGSISLVSFLFMLWFVGVARPMLPIIGVGLGIVPGLLMSRGHKIIDKDGKPFAKRTYFYILIWTISLLFTQGSTLLGLRQIMDFGFLLQGFSTAMAVILSIFLFMKAESFKGPLSPSGAGQTISTLLLVGASLAAFSMAASQVNAYTIGDPYKNKANILKAGQYVFSQEKSKLAFRNLKASKVTRTVSDMGKDGYHQAYACQVQSKHNGYFTTQGGEIGFKLGHQSLDPGKNLTAEFNKGIQLTNQIMGKMISEYNGRMYRPAVGSIGNGGTGKYWIAPKTRGTNRKPKTDIVQIVALWRYGDWVMAFQYSGTAKEPGGMIGSNPEAYLKSMLGRVTNRIKSLQVAGGAVAQTQPAQPTQQPSRQPTRHPSRAEPSAPPSADDSSETTLLGPGSDAANVQQQDDRTGTRSPSTPITGRDEHHAPYGQTDTTPDEIAHAIDEILANIESALNNAGFSEGAAAAGLAVAFAQLLAGLGMTAAYTAAIDVAYAIDSAVIETTADNSTTGSPPSDSSYPVLTDENGEPWYPDKDGRYGIEGDDGEIVWMSHDEAQASIREAQHYQRQRDRERDNFWNSAQQASNEWMDRKGEEGLKSQQEWAERQAAAEAAQQAHDERMQRSHDRMMAGIDKAYDEGDADFKADIDRLRASGDTEGLKNRYRDYLFENNKVHRAESEWQQNKADLLWVGEKTAQLTREASKGALMVLGGPAGALPTALSVGAISGAEEGAEAEARGEDLSSIVYHTAGGFAAGAKDGAISVYVNMPGTNKITKVLLPAGGDAAEMYIRTGDINKAIEAGGYSVVGDVLGMQTDKIGGRITRELTDGAVNATLGGAREYSNGGSFTDGFGNAALNHVGGKIGGNLGGRGIDASSDYGPGSRPDAEIEDLSGDQATGKPKPEMDPTEQKLRDAMAEAHTNRTRPIKTEDLPQNIQDLNDTRYTDPDDPNQREYVDTTKALDQLEDTQSSRTTKNAEDESLKDAIIATRDDKIYKPANEATLAAVKKDPEASAWLSKNMQEGDTLEMDNFSTPGTKQSLGADRDVRMIIKRTNPDGTVTKIEVPRKHWEDQAYKDFYEHSKKTYAEAGRDLDAEMQAQIDSGEGIYANRKRSLDHLQKPEFSDADLDTHRTKVRERLEAQNDIRKKMWGDDGVRSKAEIDAEVEKSVNRLQKQGLTAEQIKHRTFAESKNQLFTDKFHMEASRDNSDQTYTRRPDPTTLEPQSDDTGGIERTSVKDANVVLAQADNPKGPTLKDADGYGRMWSEKSHFYHDNKPEAIAQSQKGINQMMMLRDGQRSQGLQPAPIKRETAEAMQAISEAPTGSSATPESMTHFEERITSITDDRGNQVYRNSADAFDKVGRSVEFNKWTRPANSGLADSSSMGSSTGGSAGSSMDASMSAPDRPHELTGREANRLTLINQEREWLREQMEKDRRMSND